MRVLRIAGLPDGPLEAAAVFYAALPPPWGKGTSVAGGGVPAGTPGLEGARGEVWSTRASPAPTAWVPSSEGEDLVLIFPPADHTHRGWRLAAVQSLARDHAPLRVNALASDDPAAIESALTYLEQAEGLTGQYLTLDSLGAGTVLNSAA
jgi:hypothetical protein